ncbi:MAG: DUF924 domain-containing protein [Arenicella sp.]|nr:DUF924 domain-containing protein [Arenicella sp.]
MLEQILDFWFEEIEPARWWAKDDEFDALIRDRFGELHSQAVKCELYGWRKSPLGRLAEIIVLDQFSRNIYRDNALAFAADPLALALAQEAVAAGVDRDLAESERSFLYLPYMHSESPMVHKVAVGLYRSLGLKSNLEFELKHKAIIDRFDRYPHRNEILGRQSTHEEIEFLASPGSRF